MVLQVFLRSLSVKATRFMSIRHVPSVHLSLGLSNSLFFSTDRTWRLYHSSHCLASANKDQTDKPVEHHTSSTNINALSHIAEQQLDSNDSSNDAAIERNSKIKELGRKLLWIDLLALYHKEGVYFDRNNYATIMQQLERSPAHMIRKHPGFLSLMEDLIQIVTTKGVEWMGVSQCVMIAHAIAILNMTNDKATALVGEQLMHVLVEESAPWLVEEGTPHDVALAAWATAKLRVPAPTLFAGVERRAAWFIQEGSTTSDISKMIWACGELNVKAPGVLAELERNAQWFLKTAKKLEIALVLWACDTSLAFDAPNLRDGHSVSPTDYRRATLLYRDMDGHQLCKKCGKEKEAKYFKDIDPKTKYIVDRETCDQCRKTKSRYSSRRSMEVQGILPEGKSFCKRCMNIKDKKHFKGIDALTNKVVVRKTCNNCREVKMRLRAAKLTKLPDSAPDGQSFCNSCLAFKDNRHFREFDPRTDEIVVRQICHNCRTLEHRFKAAKRERLQSNVPAGQFFCRGCVKRKDEDDFIEYNPNTGDKIVRKTCIKCRERIIRR